MSAPNAPTLSVVNVGDGVSVTATVAGDDGATHGLLYKLAADTVWTAGLTRAGDGTITQAGLESGRQYIFQAVSALAGITNPIPCVPVSLVVRATATAITEQVMQAVRVRVEGLIGGGVVSLVTRPVRFGQQKTYQDKQADILSVDASTYDPLNADSKSWPTEGYVAWHRRLFVYFWRRISESSATPVDQQLQDGVARIVDELTDLDRPFSDPVFYVDVEEDLPVTSPDRSCDGRMIVFRLTYEHRIGNSYSQT